MAPTGGHLENKVGVLGLQQVSNSPILWGVGVVWIYIIGKPLGSGVVWAQVLGIPLKSWCLVGYKDCQFVDLMKLRDAVPPIKKSPSQPSEAAPMLLNWPPETQHLFRVARDGHDATGPTPSKQRSMYWSSRVIGCLPARTTSVDDSAGQAPLGETT